MKILFSIKQFDNVGVKINIKFSIYCTTRINHIVQIPKSDVHNDLYELGDIPHHPIYK
jgi:hypothetical protein